MNLTYFVISWKLVQNNKNYLYSMKSHLNKISEINLVFLEFERDLISGKLWLWLAPQVTLCPLCPKLLVRVQQPGDGDIGQNVNLNNLNLLFTHSRPLIESWKRKTQIPVKFCTLARVHWIWKIMLYHLRTSEFPVSSGHDQPTVCKKLL